MLEKGRKRSLSGAEVVLEMKRRFEFYELSEEDEEERDLLGKDYTLMPKHCCVEPYKGLPMEVKEDKPF